MNVFELFAKLTLDTSEYEKKLKESKNNLTSMGKDISGVGSSISKFGNGLTNSITKPALAAGTAISGIFLYKGWERLTKIDDAKAKLRALGHEGKSVNNIMDSALTSVKGTAYGLDEAATTAASAVAAGISIGGDLTKYLTAVADTAAIAGTNMSDMGAIFNKVATSGKAQNDVLSQLADKGIPIYQWLAEETGNAAEEVFKLAKDGEINLATFQSAIEKHVSGAAQELGNATLTGAIANVWAAVGRVGANFLGAADDADTFAGKLRPAIIKVQDYLGNLEEKAKEWGKVAGEVFGAFIEWVETGSASMDGMSDSAKSIWKTLEPTLNILRDILTTITDLWSNMSEEERAAAVKMGVFATMAGPVISLFGSMVTGIGGVIGAFGKMKSGWDMLFGAKTVTQAATAAKGVTTVGKAAAETGSILADVGAAAKTAGTFLVDSGLAAGAAFAGAVTGAVTLGKSLNEVGEKVKGGNGTITEFGGSIHNLNEELAASGKITSEQADALFKSSEKWESAGDNVQTMAQKYVMSLRDIGVSSDDVKTAMNSLNVSNGITADSFSALESKLVLFKGAEGEAGTGTKNLSEDFNALKNAVQNIGTEMGLSSEQMKALENSMYNTNGSAKTVGEAYNSLISTTRQIGADTEVFASKLQNDVPKAANAANQATAKMTTSTANFSTAIANIKTKLKDVTTGSSSILTSFRNSLTTVFDASSKTVSTSMNNIDRSVSSGFGSASRNAASRTTEMQRSISSAFSQMSGNVGSSMNSIVKTVTDKFGGLSTSSTTWGKDLVSNLSKGLSDSKVLKTLQDTLNNIAKKIKDTLGFSEPKEGPLSNFHTYAPDMMQLFAKGVRDNEDLVRNQVARSFDFADVISNGYQGIGGAPAARGGFTQYINITSPKALDAVENARLIRNSTRDMVLSLSV